MGAQRKIICTICLQICDNFKAIEKDIKYFLDMLQLKMDFVAIQFPVMCTNCADMLMKCFDFKMKCINTHEYIRPPFINKDTVKLDLIDLYLRQNENGTGISEVKDICGFCMSPIINPSAISIDNEDGDVVLKNMIKQCLPELDFTLIKKPAICAPCYDSLENCFHFVSNCFIVDEKIKKYREIQNINGDGQLELSSLLEFMVKDVTATEKMESPEERETGIEGDSKQFVQNSVLVNEEGIIKIEETFWLEKELKEDISIISTTEKTENPDEREAGIEYENKEFVQKSILAFKEDVIKKEEMVCLEMEPKKEIIEIEDQKFLLDEEIEIKTAECDFNRIEDALPLPKISTRVHEEQICLMQDLKEDLSKPYIKQTSTEKNESEITMCNYNSCLYQTKYKHHLNAHFLKYKDPSEVTMFKCDSCSFQTKYIEELKKHRDPSKVTMYKCDTCSYQTIRKYDLKKHLLTHKDPMYKCDYCSYEAKQICNLKEHLLEHKDPSEVTMYKCDFCLYQTKHKNNFKAHLLGHKDPSEVTMYKCNSCLFQTKYRSVVKKHLLSHKDPSEITMYKCDSCSYQTKFKSNLKAHFLKHTDPSEATMYKCDSCLFKTKHRSCLKRHLLNHENPSEVIMYKCDSCLYQTKHKSNLKAHFLKHKDPLEAIMYKCDSCSYQTKDKSVLKRHLLKHKDPSEVTMYKCDFCLYQTKYKSNLRAHFLKHEDASEGTV